MPTATRARRRVPHGHRPGWQRTVVLVPAHNEEVQLAAAVESVLAQTLPVHQVVVVPDNCTDQTVQVARRYPVTVLETVGNRHRKAGALNQAWARYAADARFVVTIDADTVLAPDCLERMHDELRRRKRVGGVCARTLTKPAADPRTAWRALVGRLVALDFAMNDRTIVRRRYSVEVLGGFASMLRNRALHDIAGRHGTPWATDSIVEDYRLSLQLREAGWSIRMSRRARAFTDTPDTVRGLWRQRLRWCGGTFEELLRTGWKPWTRRSWLTYLGMLAGLTVRLVGVAAWVGMVGWGVVVGFSPLWLIPVAVAALDRLVVASRLPDADWAHRLLAVLVLPLELLSLVGQAWALRSMWLVIRRRRLVW